MIIVDPCIMVRVLACNVIRVISPHALPNVTCFVCVLAKMLYKCFFIVFCVCEMADDSDAELDIAAFQNCRAIVLAPPQPAVARRSAQLCERMRTAKAHLSQKRKMACLTEQLCIAKDRTLCIIGYALPPRSC